MSRNTLFFMAAVMILFVSSGCKDANIVKVSGKITVEGKPVGNLHVSFQPVAVQGENALGPSAWGVTDEQGNFELKAVNIDKKITGATVGANRVKITARGPEKKPDEVVYTGTWKSPLPGGVPSIETTFEVPRGGTSEANFDLPLK
ncbi:MAG: hypothetical protein Q4G68_12975 [Planctomycetia bacterium]|nr:hypothetical protein [Planctomycetia bacterium]